CALPISENVRFVFSTPKDDPVMDVFKRMNCPVITIPALDIESRKCLIKDYLLSFGKKLTPPQIDRIANDEESSNPMILRALLDELRFFGVFEKLDEEIDRYLAAKSIPDFYIKVLERLEKIFDYTDTAASNLSMDILSLLYVSRNGLSEAEITSLSGAKPLYWSQLYNAVKGNLIVCGGLINFSHNYIREAIKFRYFAEKDNENSYRLWLIHYFKTNPNVSKKRTYHELPYQFFNIGDLSGLYRFLMNYDVLEYWVKTDIVEFGKYWRVLREADKKKYPIEKYLELNAKKKDKDDLYSLYSFLGMFIAFLGDDNAMALKFTQDALVLREEILGKEHEDTLTDYNNLGQMYFTMGEHQKALEYYQRALDIRKKTGGGNNSDTAVSYNNMGQVYYTMGNYQKALEYHQLALDIQKEICGEKDIDTATSYSNIGLIYSSLKNTQKALYYAQRALDIQKEILGEKHINTATSYNNIGEINTLMGNYQKALEYYQRALNIKEEILGKEHPQSVLIRNNLIGIHIISAAAYYKKGDNDAAAASIKEAADLGCEDPAALVAKCKLPLPDSTL
ncbi:MAG: tetratricopeptide repeat protein, partial [Treponema sp.]|nr:tetratricopeptide repeat protein [Treponema sp.]